MSKSFETTPTRCSTQSLSTPSQSLKAQKTPSWFVPMNNTHCETCGKEQQIEDCLTCSKCDKAFHMSCTELPTYELVKYAKRNLYRRKYICRICVEKLHPSDTANIIQNRLINNKSGDQDSDEYLKRLQELSNELKCKEKNEEDLKREVEKLRQEEKKLTEEVERKDKQVRNVMKELQRSNDHRAMLQEQVSSLQKRNERQKEKEEKEKEEELRKTIREETKEIEGALKELNKRLARVENAAVEENCRPTSEEPAASKQMTQHPGGPQRGSFTYGRRSQGRGPRCFGCGRLGHIVRNCYQQQRRYTQYRYNNDRSNYTRANSYSYNTNTHPYPHQRTQSYNEENERFLRPTVRPMHPQASPYRNTNMYESQPQRQHRVSYGNPSIGPLYF